MWFGYGRISTGADVIRSVFASELKVPVLIVNNYDLPAWVDNRLWVIASSYSGNTEEAENAAKQAKQRRLG